MDMKIKPIFEYLYNYHSLPVEMRCGYRFDEFERADTFTDVFKMSYQCDLDRRIHRWKDITWRIGKFPMIEEKVGHYTVSEFWKEKGSPIKENF